MSELQAHPVSVLFYYDGDAQYAHPVRLYWQDREYELGGVQFWYSEHRGSNLVHHYTIGDKAGHFTFKLALETENLTWKLEQMTEVEVEQPTAQSFMSYSFAQLAGA